MFQKTSPRQKPCDHTKSHPVYLYGVANLRRLILDLNVRQQIYRNVDDSSQIDMPLCPKIPPFSHINY